MKHLKKGRKFHRERDQRKALLKSLAPFLILHEMITTTLEKANETKITLDILITIAQKQDLAALINVIKKLSEKAANKLYYEIAPLFAKRKGGYTRIIKTSERRVRDAVPLVILEFVDKPVLEKAEIKQTELEKQQK